LGYSDDDVIGKQTPEILHLAEESQVRGAELSAELGIPVSGFDVFTKKAQITGQDSRQWTYVRKDGILLKVSLVVTPIRNGLGVVDGYLSIARDITNEYVAQKALKSSEAKLRSLFELSPLGIAMTDLQGHFIEFNSAFCRICGYPENELKTLDYWALTPKEYEVQEQHQLQMLLETGHYGPYEKEYRRKNGSLIPLRLNGMIVKKPYHSAFIWSIVEDISQSKAVEDTLRQAKLAADSANLAKSEFVSTVSHELRTPLTSIQGAIELVLGGATGELPEQPLKLLTIASNNCKRLVRLINDILDLEKLESGKITLDLKPIDIVPLVQQTIESNQAYAKKFDIRIVLTCDLTELFVLADEDSFIQALTNLLANAIKFSHRNSEVDVAITTTGQNLLLSVTDYGIGINDAFKTRLFEKFTQEDASNSRQKGGTGLGLSITKAMLEQMGGTIGYDSELGKKTRFFFELPLYQE
jgi:PAS domain S-box-containing protein